LHNVYVSLSNHMMFARMLFNLIEPSMTQDVPAVISSILDTSVERLEAAALIQEEVVTRLEASKAGETETDLVMLVERARPVQGAAYALEKPEDILSGL
jgi:transformation/transcription domain-associated protein